MERIKLISDFGVDLQNLLLEFQVLLLCGRRLSFFIFVVSTPIDVENPAKDGDTVLFEPSPTGFENILRSKYKGIQFSLLSRPKHFNAATLN